MGSKSIGKTLSLRIFLAVAAMIRNYKIRVISPQPSFSTLSAMMSSLLNHSNSLEKNYVQLLFLEIRPS
jgi:hypothetical protein